MKIEDLFDGKGGEKSGDIADIAHRVILGARAATLKDVGIYGEGHTKRLSLTFSIPLNKEDRVIELSRSFFLATKFLKPSDKGDEQRAAKRLTVTALGQLVEICTGTPLEAQLRQIEGNTPQEILTKAVEVVKAHLEGNNKEPILVTVVIAPNKRPDKAVEYPLDIVQILRPGSVDYSNAARDAIQFIKTTGLNTFRDL